MSPTMAIIGFLIVLAILLLVWNIALTTMMAKLASKEEVDKKFSGLCDLAYKSSVTCRSVTYNYQYKYTIPESTHGTPGPGGMCGSSGRICGGVRGVCPYGTYGTPESGVAYAAKDISLQDLLNLLLDHLDLKIELIPSQEEKLVLVYSPEEILTDKDKVEGRHGED